MFVSEICVWFLLFPFLFLNYTLVKLFYGLPLDKEPWLAARASSLGGSSAAIPLSQESKLMFLDVIPYKQNKQKWKRSFDSSYIWFLSYIQYIISSKTKWHILTITGPTSVLSWGRGRRREGGGVGGWVGSVWNKDPHCWIFMAAKSSLAKPITLIFIPRSCRKARMSLLISDWQLVDRCHLWVNIQQYGSSFAGTPSLPSLPPPFAPS